MSEYEDSENDGEWDDTVEEAISMTVLYRVQQVLMRKIVCAPQKQRYGELEKIINDFIPKGYTKRKWIRECQNAMIQGWIDNDNVFNRAFNIRNKTLTAEQQVAIALYHGLDYAMKNGLWNDEHIALLEYIKKGEKQEDDGA